MPATRSRAGWTGSASCCTERARRRAGVPRRARRLARERRGARTGRREPTGGVAQRRLDQRRRSGGRGSPTSSPTASDPTGPTITRAGTRPWSRRCAATSAPPASGSRARPTTDRPSALGRRPDGPSAHRPVGPSAQPDGHGTGRARTLREILTRRPAAPRLRRRARQPRTGCGVRRSAMRRLVLGFVLVVLLAACDWPMLGGDPARTGTSGDTSIALGSVSTLTQAWTTGTDFTASATAKGHVFRESASTTPPGSRVRRSPEGLTPVWTNAPAPTGAWAVVDGSRTTSASRRRRGTTDSRRSTPRASAAAPGRRRSARRSGRRRSRPHLARTGGRRRDRLRGREGGLLAFDATTGARRWKGVTPAGTARGVPAVANGVVTIGDAGDVYTFDAAGKNSCVAAFAVCAPLWRGIGGQGGAQAMANGSVYVVTATGLKVFDAAAGRAARARRSCACRSGPRPARRGTTRTSRRSRRPRCTWRPPTACSSPSTRRGWRGAAAHRRRAPRGGPPTSAPTSGRVTSGCSRRS